MKKFFFFFLLCFPIFVSAGAIQDFTVKNGELSRKFESDNNIYSVKLNENEDKFLFDYKLNDESSSVLIDGVDYLEGEENKTIIQIETSDHQKEVYTFYLEKENVSPVFQESIVNQTVTKKEIPFLKQYVIFGCAIIIIFLFKVIVLGFKKKHIIKYDKVNRPSWLKIKWHKRK